MLKNLVTVVCGLGLTLSCKTIHKSTCEVVGGQQNIVGGFANPSAYPASLMLFIDKGEKFENCGGTFISDSLLLTAGHCLSSAVSVTIVSTVPGPFAAKSKTVSRDFFRHPDFQEIYINGEKQIPLALAYADIGIVRFPAGTASGEAIAPLAVRAPAVGDGVVVVGYGHNTIENTGAGVKRVGRNVIASLDAEHQETIRIDGYDVGNGSDDKAINAKGDSGSALYNEQGQMLGTASARALNRPAEGLAFGIYTNLFNAKTRSFLKDYVGEGALASASSTRALLTADPLARQDATEQGSCP